MVLLARQAFAASMRWSGGRFGRRVLTVAAALGCVIALAGYWAMQGQFQGW